jgi:hypothetical protein
MGWAARVKQQQRGAGEQTTCGNPEPVRLRQREIDRARMAEAVKAGRRHVIVNFSDRRYEIDALTGVLRRLRPAIGTTATLSTR